ncbi:MAG: hypothetical protein AAGA90_12425, partial [Actinomycetota bacterium]
AAPPPAAPAPAPAAPAPAPAAPEPPRAMPDAVSGPGATDPHQLGAAVNRLSGSTRKASAAAFAVAAVSLADGEIVQMAIGCRFLGADGAVLLTDRQMMIVNDRSWEPDVVPVALEAGLTVQGWQDDRWAALVFARDGHELVVDRIGDRAIAQELAAEVRRRSEG